MDSRLLCAGQRVSGVQTASESVEDTVAGSGGQTTGEAHVLYSPFTCTERFTRRWAGGSNLPPKKHGEILEKNLSPEQEACSIFPSPPAGLLPIPSPPPASLPILHPALHTFHHIPSTYPTPNTLTFILPLLIAYTIIPPSSLSTHARITPSHWGPCSKYIPFPSIGNFLPIHCKTSFPSIATPPSNQ